MGPLFPLFAQGFRENLCLRFSAADRAQSRCTGRCGSGKMFFCGNNCSALFAADPFKLSVPDGAVLWGVLNINAAGRADPGAGGAPDTGFGSFGIWSVNAFLNSSKNWTDGRRAKRLAASDTKPAQDALPGICFERERGMRRDMAEPHQFHNCGVIRCLRVHQAEQCFSYSLNSFRIGIHPQTAKIKTA